MNHVVTNMAHSARERLKNMAKAGGRDADYLFQRYAFERFFNRIGESRYADRFILKGASLFTLWMGPMFRVTQDTDLESSLTPDHGRMAAVFREIAKTPLPADDGVVFDFSSLSVENIKKQDNYKGLRAKFHARMGQARLPLQFDIGFGDSVYPRAEVAEYPVLLGGPPPRIKVYPQYTVVAEKFAATVELGMANSRPPPSRLVPGNETVGARPGGNTVALPCGQTRLGPLGPQIRHARIPFASLLALLGRLLSDFCHLLIDPRIRFDNLSRREMRSRANRQIGLGRIDGPGQNRQRLCQARERDSD